MIKLLIGGSPCTYWSIAQKNGRETEASGMGWELFKNFLIAKEKFNPDFFLYENNKSAAQPIKDQISTELGVDLMYINSALVSAQNRQRFYAFNWEVEQPEDRGILLRDILESGENLSSNEKSYALTTRCSCATPEDTLKRSRHTMVAESVDFSKKPDSSCNRIIKKVQDVYSKTRTLTASSWKGVESDGMPAIAEPVRIGQIENNLKNKNHDSKQYRVYSPDGKSTTLCGQGGGVGAKTGLYACPVLSEREIDYMFRKEGRTDYGYIQNTNRDKAQCITANIHKGVPYNCLFDEVDGQLCFTDANGKKVNVYEVCDGLITIKGKQYPIKLQDGYYIIRKLTVKECCRLQTMPDDYCRAVSNSQAYKGLGNGWTAEVIIHILNGALKDVPRDEEIVVLSMYDGIGTGRYCLDKMGFTNVRYFAYEIDKYAKQISMSNYPDIIQLGDAFDLRHPDWTIGY